jgi:hypothetical protein
MVSNISYCNFLATFLLEKVLADLDLLLFLLTPSCIHVVHLKSRSPTVQLYYCIIV